VLVALHKPVDNALHCGAVSPLPAARVVEIFTAILGQFLE